MADNEEIGRKVGPGGRRDWTLERLLGIFPLLGSLLKRLGGTLSGGEQHVVTIARTPMGNPEVPRLDEPSEGLAPALVKSLAEFVEWLRAEGASVLLSEVPGGVIGGTGEETTAWRR